MFRPDGRVTAGNSSPMNDGAAALMLGDARAAWAWGGEPLARHTCAVSGIEPHRATASARSRPAGALDRAGIGWADLAVVELNEAFAAQALACLVQWPELDRSIVNPNGGAVALGHPIGCSGARIFTTLAHELHPRWRLGPGNDVHRYRPGHHRGPQGLIKSAATYARRLHSVAWMATSQKLSMRWSRTSMVF